MGAAFTPFSTGLTQVGLGLIVIGGGAAVLAVACLALMNMWAIFDPRMGMAVKGNLVRVILSGILLAGAGGASTVLAALPH